MNKKWISRIGSSVLITTLVIAGTSFAKMNDSEISGGTIRLEKQVEADFPALARLTITQAVQKAVTAVQGHVLKTALENDNSFLIYSIEVVTADKTIMEVKVDAGSGKVLGIDKDKADGKDHESAENDDDKDHWDVGLQ